jgi:hypothetical protein
MARKRRRKGQESVSGFFRQVFEEQPNLLNEKGSNAILMQRWDAAHPNQTTAARRRVMQNLSNVKSLLRHKRRRGKGRGGRPAVAVMEPQAGGNNDLLNLELQIDECLTQARKMDSKGMEEVIHHLRHARNGVVWKLGED